MRKPAKHGDTVVLLVEERLVYGNRQELKQPIITEIDNGEKKFAFDFSQNVFVDSSGLAVLLSIQKKIKDAGGTLELRNLSNDLLTTMELTKLEDFFTIVK